MAQLALLVILARLARLAVERRRTTRLGRDCGTATARARLGCVRLEHSRCSCASASTRLGLGRRLVVGLGGADGVVVVVVVVVIVRLLNDLSLRHLLHRGRGRVVVVALRAVLALVGVAEKVAQPLALRVRDLGLRQRPLIVVSVVALVAVLAAAVLLVEVEEVVAVILGRGLALLGRRDCREAVVALVDVRNLVEAALAKMARAGGLPLFAVASKAAAATASTTASDSDSVFRLEARLARRLEDLLAIVYRQQLDDDLAKVGHDLLHRPAKPVKRRRDRLDARLLGAVRRHDRSRDDGRILDVGADRSHDLGQAAHDLDGHHLAMRLVSVQIRLGACLGRLLVLEVDEDLDDRNLQVSMHLRLVAFVIDVRLEELAIRNAINHQLGEGGDQLRRELHRLNNVRIGLNNLRHSFLTIYNRIL